MVEAKTENKVEHDVLVKFYRDDYPVVDEVVMCIFTHISEMAAEVQLVEYCRKPGIIPSSELTRRKYRLSNKIAKIGQRQACIVTKVDQVKGYIDISKNKLNKSSEAECDRKFSRGQKSINLIKDFYLDFYKPETFDVEKFTDICNRSIWQLDAKDNIKGSSYVYLKKSYHDPSILDKHTKLSTEEKAGLLKIVNAKLSPKQIKMRVDMEVRCRKEAGVNAIIHSFVTAKQVLENPDEILMKCFSPKYSVICSGIDQTQMRSKLEKVIDKIKQNIEIYDGTFSCSEPVIIGDEKDKLTDHNSIAVDDNSSDSEDTVNMDMIGNSEDEEDESSALSDD